MCGWAERSEAEGLAANSQHDDDDIFLLALIKTRTTAEPRHAFSFEGSFFNPVKR